MDSVGSKPWTISFSEPLTGLSTGLKASGPGRRPSPSPAPSSGCASHGRPLRSATTGTSTSANGNVRGKANANGNVKGKANAKANVKTNDHESDSDSDDAGCMCRVWSFRRHSKSKSKNKPKTQKGCHCLPCWKTRSNPEPTPEHHRCPYLHHCPHKKTQVAAGHQNGPKSEETGCAVGNAMLTYILDEGEAAAHPVGKGGSSSKT